MKYEITEEQIKELAKGSAKVKNMFPEVFEPLFFEIGKWYYDKSNDWLFCYNSNNRAYGFVKGIYGNDYSMCSTLGFRLATDSEVEEALTNEAKKRGFKNCVCFNIANGERKVHIDKNSRYAFDSYNNKLLMNNWCIFENGKWAVIIKTYTKEEAEKSLNAKII